MSRRFVFKNYPHLFQGTVKVYVYDDQSGLKFSLPGDIVLELDRSGIE